MAWDGRDIGFDLGWKDFYGGNLLWLHSWSKILQLHALYQDSEPGAHSLTEKVCISLTGILLA